MRTRSASSRFREKYAAKMAQTPDARAFEMVSAPLGTDGAEFRDIARAAAAIDTLDGFLRDMQARFPDASPAATSPVDGAGPRIATDRAGDHVGSAGHSSARRRALLQKRCNGELIFAWQQKSLGLSRGFCLTPWVLISRRVLCTQ